MQTGESWDMVLHAKSRGAHNLHKASLQCKELDHFVMWSSFVASAGNEGAPASAQLWLRDISCSLSADHLQHTW